MDVTDHWVYKVYDVDDVLLYVGVTGAGPGRVSAHARSSSWAPLAATILVEHFADRARALDREVALIREHRPHFNISGNPDAHRLMDGEMSPATAALLTRSSARTIHRAIRAGALPARKGARGYIIDEDDLRSWVESSQVVPDATR